VSSSDAVDGTPGDGGVRWRAHAPGRVNLIGDHTDYMGGLVLPMAVQLGTTIDATRGGASVELRSDQFELPASIELPVRRAAATEPSWARYVAGVAQVLDARVGLRGEIRSTLPVGAGLSSSAALEVATALALGDDGPPVDLARRCQEAEHLATGVPCGIMDQLAVVAGRAGHALLLDCDTLVVRHVRVPDHACLWVLHSGQPRTLAGSEYARRRQECERAVAEVGPLPRADPATIEAIADAVVRRRARHVRSECERVRLVAAALAEEDLEVVGRAMVESHRSLRDDFEVSTPALDALVEQLCATEGVLGARLTGAGFGGCVVALARPDVTLPGWRVEPADGARLVRLD
jgi:galactokinase